MKHMKLGSLLLTCFLLACTDDIAERQPGTTSSGEDTIGPVSIEPNTVTAGEDPSATSVDGTGPTSETSSSGETGSSSGDSGSSSDDTGGNGSWPRSGEVIITEIMRYSNLWWWADGAQWFEIYNPTPGASFQLEGCTVDSADDSAFTIDVDLVIGPGEYRIFASESVDLGFIADYHWPATDLDIASWSDAVWIECSDVTVDYKGWNPYEKEDHWFPGASGISASLDPGSYDALANNLDDNWCQGTTPYTIHGNLGTPRYSNPVCDADPVDYPIDACRLQLPDVIVEDQGTDVTAYGRLHIAGLTDLSGVGDPAQRVLGHVGYGPAGTDPAVDATWTWVAAVPHPNYDPGSPGYEADHDEYWAHFELPGPGMYDYAYRFTGDGGTTFTYCDGQAAGSTDGYQPANAGHMTSNVVIPPVLYFSEYMEGSFNQALEIYNPTAQAVDIDACELHYFVLDDMAQVDIELAGSIAADDVLVVCNDDNMDTSFCDVLELLVVSGNDAIELECSGVTLDVIGQIGFDPGAEWLVNGVGTRDETLRRSCSVTAGDSNGADVFDPSLEWATFPQDDFSDFGQYVCP